MRATDLQYVSEQCLKWGRLLAQYQNLPNIHLPKPSRPRLWWRWFWGLFYTEFPPERFQLTSQSVTEITNALMSAGNILETEAKKALAQTNANGDTK